MRWPKSARRKKPRPSAPRQLKAAHDMATPVQPLGSLIALSIALSSSAVACEPKPLSDTDESFALAAAKRMTRLGVTDVEPAAPLKDGGGLYVLLGSKVRVALCEDGGYPKEVGTVLSEPSNSDDRNRQVALISFMLARIGGGAEAQITKMLETSFAAHHDNRTWQERA